MKGKKMCRYFGASLLMVILTWSMVLCSAHAWWNEDWKYRKKIGFDTAATGADIKQNLAGFPVLIRLHSGNFDFTRAKENGEDLRFVASDDLSLLKYHVESFDPFDEIAFIWVKVPDIPGSSNQGAVWMYYGNPEAGSGEDKKNSFDEGYLGVYHLNEIEGFPQDVSRYMMHTAEFTAGLGLAGIIGNGATFSGAGNVMRIPDNPVLDFSRGFTFSTWIKMFSPQTDAYVFYKGTLEENIIISVQGSELIVQVKHNEQIYKNDATTQIPLEGWHHLAVTIHPEGRVTIYLDGAEIQWMRIKTNLAGYRGDIYVGADASGTHSFSGDLDEIRISGIARSADVIRADFESQGPQAPMTSFSIEEMNENGSGMPVFYLATIFKNITLDGLVVIFLLLILSGGSWVVMISKGVFLFNMSKDDRGFLNQYECIQDTPLSFKGEEFSNSGLYRMYHAGRRSLGDLPEDISNFSISRKRIEALKAVLEKSYIEESKRLNSWLVVLIMSISGGPFLGLLGTVWGVMNTFAAMAEAGEANIMAIAPGVASALSTTVFGLIVAIPALFGYNYLAGKIRDITADNGIFVDQLALKIDTVYGGES